MCICDICIKFAYSTGIWLSTTLTLGEEEPHYEEEKARKSPDLSKEHRMSLNISAIFVKFSVVLNRLSLTEVK